MQGRRPRDVAPSLFEISKRKNRTLYEALHANTWIRDIDLQHPSFAAHHFAEFVQVWKETQQIHLRSGVQYEIAWKLTESKQYSASSAYHAQFLGASSPNFTELIWRAWAQWRSQGCSSPPSAQNAMEPPTAPFKILEALMKEGGGSKEEEGSPASPAFRS